MAEFIVSPGQTGTLTDTSPTVITVTVAGKTGPLAIASLQDVSMPMSKDVFTWTQMNKSGKRQIPTTSSNSLTTNIVLDKDGWEGVVADVSNVAGSAAVLGLFGLTTGGVKVAIAWNIGASSYTAEGYITGVTPAVSTDSPVWVTPITFTIDGDITLGA